MKSYKQLTQEERYQISALVKGGHGQSEIAEILKRHPATISRELARNTGLRGYRPAQAQSFTDLRREWKVQRRISETLWSEVESLLREDWSPEQISGRLRKEQGVLISHEWIYLYIYEDKATGGDLHLHLRCQKKRRKRYGGRDRRGSIKGRVSIDERPKIVEKRSRVGHWEGDTIVGKGHRGALVSLVERKSRFTRLASVERNGALEVSTAITQSLRLYKNNVQTLTVDNGKEFSDHAEIAESLGAKVYFAHPHAPYERGTNENTNGLVRQYFPKGMALDNLSNREVSIVEDRLNHRPRKTLGFKTPHEVFFNTRSIMTVALTS